MQHVRVGVLPQRLHVRRVPVRLHQLHVVRDVPAVQQRPAHPARRHCVRLGLPQRLLLERCQLCGLPADVRDVCDRHDVRELHAGLGDAAAERHELRGDVPRGDVPERQQLPCVQQQLPDVHGGVDDVHVVPRGPGAEHADQHVRRQLPDGLCGCCGCLQPVRDGLLWCDVPAMQLRHWRRVRPRHQRDGRVHVPDRLLPVDGGCAVQHVPERLLLEWHELHRLLRQLHVVHVHDDMHAVPQWLCCAAQRLLFERLPVGLLFERCRVRGLR